MLRREDALCVIHLHTDHGIAVVCSEEWLLPISTQSLFALSSLGYHEYEGLALNETRKSRLVADLGNKNNLILANHGFTDSWQNSSGSVSSMYILESACRIQILAQSGRRSCWFQLGPDS